MSAGGRRTLKTRRYVLESLDWAKEASCMCRNIKTLANFAPAATDDEIRASAIQFVRKLSGSNKPSRANEEAFNRAVDEVFNSARRLIDSLSTVAPPRNRDE